MFNLYGDTHHETGIVLYGNNESGIEIGVFNWGQFEDNRIPLLSPAGGLVISWPCDESFVLSHVARVSDIRSLLPGSYWLDGEYLDTDMNVIYDEFLDLPGLFGFGPAAEVYEDDSFYAGDIYQLSDGTRFVVCDIWD